MVRRCANANNPEIYWQGLTLENRSKDRHQTDTLQAYRLSGLAIQPLDIPSTVLVTQPGNILLTDSVHANCATTHEERTTLDVVFPVAVAATATTNPMMMMICYNT